MVHSLCSCEVFSGQFLLLHVIQAPDDKFCGAFTGQLQFL
jgi:hypothetical protein